ncbi:MAG: AMP-binding protein, partial [Rhodospirillales bacterium]|nr:AMP-binding protein [Rhodospirillales bacterium]
MSGLLTRGNTYDDVYRAFNWNIPERINMGVVVCDRHADADANRTALTVLSPDGSTTTHSFGEIKRLSNKLANLLAARGMKKGDRLGILLSQSLETPVAHVAAWKSGLISIPLFTLFGEDALEFRLSNSSARAMITDHANLPKILAIRDRLPELELILVTEPTAEGNGIVDFWKAMNSASDSYTPLDTLADEPALIIYTSGTTGNPKGALHAHRTILGHLPGVEFPHEFFPQDGDLFWTPADWAWIGGLMNVLMTSWFHGMPVLASRARKYDPEDALRLMATHGVRNTFMPPTALKMMRQVENPKKRFGVNLRTVAVAGEAMGAELLEWGRDALGVTFNEFYGQTECNLVVANCAPIMDIKPGSMGRPIPGHSVDIIDAGGQICANGDVGNIAVMAPDPVMFLQYWDNPKATEEKYVSTPEGKWLLTGDQGYRDEDGYLWFVGRDDDLITSAGYRIGPG